MLKQIRPAVMSVVLFTVFAGLLFPLAITLAAQALFRWQANGSLIRRGGTVIGSRLIGQQFDLPGYFHPRPSSAGAGYDATDSGGSNLGPTSAKLINGVHSSANRSDSFAGVADLAAAYRRENGLAPNVPIPADAVTRSASGLDPDISPANANLQAARVAQARRLPLGEVRSIIAACSSGRTLGFLGEPRVNVLEMNLRLDRAGHRGG
ncbi:MAG: K(+)-transporting ATPase subunit C [Armatimonadetes bacterium]|nr:K(+)-transporting ATPase subunit C [Armatimonadota bacterium]MDE2207246.1 K(+)-transporting ATPase subunit C [Armatimonadota bacterium]